MNLLSVITFSFQALTQNKMRSLLTCLGIIIGIAAVIAMMEIGGGSARSIEQAISSLGASVIQIDPASVTVGGVSTSRGGRATLTLDDADAIRNEVQRNSMRRTQRRFLGPSGLSRQELAPKSNPRLYTGLLDRSKLAGGKR